MLKTYRASCHCGEVVIEAELDIEQPSFRCNCSICRRTRFWPSVAKPEGFRQVTGESELIKYSFGSKKNHHFFCKHCGVRVFGVGSDTPIGKMYGVNIGCLEGISESELEKIPVVYVDGRHDRWDSGPEYYKHL
ncbi:GFA family protein [Billgrantia pellis]|uniref:GFA family protein n=1 Tax=Billgrantia pellis TaxID=2606936 RepID=A0A7V7KFD2_9GAMM|nr:GFA family protein [Halomonas pellis]KAA0009969.1 GFA family protein [Halomonas pellis]